LAAYFLKKDSAFAKPSKELVEIEGASCALIEALFEEQEGFGKPERRSDSTPQPEEMLKR
jgi:hypothetical protein